MLFNGLVRARYYELAGSILHMKKLKQSENYK